MLQVSEIIGIGVMRYFGNGNALPWRRNLSRQEEHRVEKKMFILESCNPVCTPFVVNEKFSRMMVMGKLM